MSTTCAHAPIRLLSPQLADQIAAGEVIERPASVLKELIENSIDAGSTRIDVELLNGGMNLVRVTDDGFGIERDELALAVSRHATSKISHLEDLLALLSLGFRGEALASICSVSEWEIISRRLGEDLGARLTQRSFQAEDAAHAVGTSVNVQNLFFNIPARRKFLRSESTEYRHCEDVITRLALSRADVGFFVHHNKRLTYRLPAAVDDLTRTRRVTQLLGESFIQQALMIEYAHQGLRLTGWLSVPSYSRQQSDSQYFFINGRGVRDRIINHAIRQAYQDLIPVGRHPAYVLYLEIDPRAVDVNVHPTKYEVRFHENRRIHDFLSRCIRDSLRNPATEYPTAYKVGAPVGLTQTVQGSIPSVAEQNRMYVQPYGMPPAEGQLLFHRYYLQETAQGLKITDLWQVRVIVVRQQLTNYRTQPVVKRPLLIPQEIEVSTTMLQQYEKNAALLAALGFDISITENKNLMLRTVPTRVAAPQIDQLIRESLEILISNINESAATLVIEAVCNHVQRMAQPIYSDQLEGLLAEIQHSDNHCGDATWLVNAEQFSQWCQQLRG